eukprot:TRINITY_DN8432_c0_g1_i6.p1 TRINITY_DN8432_c0_g1~~TRINITY_DN8432_c0_g1_i6.p1  ORF type:complete len:148 (+),score=26.67 TRINITY_DN8432_c0_g1_i6:215-658(+)
MATTGIRRHMKKKTVSIPHVTTFSSPQKPALSYVTLCPLFFGDSRNNHELKKISESNYRDMKVLRKNSRRARSFITQPLSETKSRLEEAFPLMSTLKLSNRKIEVMNSKTMTLMHENILPNSKTFTEKKMELAVSYTHLTLPTSDLV